MKTSIKIYKDEYDEDDEDNHYIKFLFKIKNDFETTVLLNEPYMYNKEDWTNLYNGNKVTMDFCDSNGCVNLVSDGTFIFFYVCKMGAGGDGSITMKVTLDNCKESIQKYIDFLTINENKNKENIEESQVLPNTV
jgi:hypothetical protein